MRAIKLTLVALLTTTAIGFAQKAKDAAPTTPPPTAAVTESLEDLLAKALQNSPEIQLAEGKLREVDAQLRQTRLKVAQKVVELHVAMEQQKLVLENVQEVYEVYKRSGNAASRIEVSKAKQELQTAKGQLAQVEAQLNALTGRLPALANLAANIGGGGVGGFGGMQPGLGGVAVPPDETPKRMPPPAMTQRMRKALDQSMKLADKKVDALPLKEVIELVRQQAPDVPFLVKLADKQEQPITIDFKGDLTLASCCQLLCDSVPGLRIVVRDYGFMVTFDDELPENAMDVLEFWTHRDIGA